MFACALCGEENPKDVRVCRDCGFELVPREPDDVTELDQILETIIQGETAAAAEGHEHGVDYREVNELLDSLTDALVEWPPRVETVRVFECPLCDTPLRVQAKACFGCGETFSEPPPFLMTADGLILPRTTPESRTGRREARETREDGGFWALVEESSTVNERPPPAMKRTRARRLGVRPKDYVLYGALAILGVEALFAGYGLLGAASALVVVHALLFGAGIGVVAARWGSLSRGFVLRASLLLAGGSLLVFAGHEWLASIAPAGGPVGAIFIALGGGMLAVGILASISRRDASALWFAGVGVLALGSISRVIGSSLSGTAPTGLDAVWAAAAVLLLLAIGLIAYRRRLLRRRPRPGHRPRRRGSTDPQGRGPVPAKP